MFISYFKLFSVLSILSNIYSLDISLNTTGPSTIGIWWWTWSSYTAPPSGTNCG